MPCFLFQESVLRFVCWVLLRLLRLLRRKLSCVAHAFLLLTFRVSAPPAVVPVSLRSPLSLLPACTPALPHSLTHSRFSVSFAPSLCLSLSLTLSISRALSRTSDLQLVMYNSWDHCIDAAASFPPPPSLPSPPLSLSPDS